MRGGLLAPQPTGCKFSTAWAMAGCNRWLSLCSCAPSCEGMVTRGGGPQAKLVVQCSKAALVHCHRI